MAGFFARGGMKPPLGAYVNPEHPFAQGLLAAVLFNEGMGTPQIVPMGVFAVTISTVVGTPVWASNTGGRAFRFAATTDYLRLASNTDPIGTTAITICLVRRKTDTTARASWSWGHEGGSADKLARAAIPHADGTVYWDCGGSGAPNRLTASGLTITTAEERWIVTAGPNGSAIWQNGIKVASQSTLITRNVNTGGFYLNRLQAGSDGDLQEMNFWQSSAVQWSDDRCRWWSAEPYAHLYSATAVRRYFDLSGGSVLGGGGSGRLVSLGVG